MQSKILDEKEPDCNEKFHQFSRTALNGRDVLALDFTS